MLLLIKYKLKSVLILNMSFLSVLVLDFYRNFVNSNFSFR
jgi:hypothetical protein